MRTIRIAGFPEPQHTGKRRADREFILRPRVTKLYDRRNDELW
jgi:hypothetical protein